MTLIALQLCPFSPHLTDNIARRYDVTRWYEFSSSEQSAWLAQHAADVGAVVTGGHIGCDTALMDELPNLGIIAINGVGFDKVDLDHARSRGVRVTTTPDVLTDDVADLAIGLTIGLLRGLPVADRHVRGDAWPSGELPLARKVSGRTFGIVGLGRIGSAIAERLAAFGPVAYSDPIEKPVPWRHYQNLADLAQDVDVLILASAANAATRHLIGANVLAALGPAGYLVNVARGSLVDEAALIEALANGTIAGAALDVFEDEPNVPEALRRSNRVVLSPHIASATVETRTRMADVVIENLDAFRAGEPLPGAVA